MPNYTEILEALEELGRKPSFTPAAGWSAHYAAEEAVRTLVKAELATRLPVFTGTPETPEAIAEFDAFWTSYKE